MAVTVFNEGALSPLLSVCRLAGMISIAILLTACSHKASPPPFTASGYVVDDGAVRLWRKNASSGEIRLLSVLSPWHQGATVTCDYRWQNDGLAQVNINIYSSPPEHIRVRFDERGEVSFMQRERDGQKLQLSSDDIALYRYHAERIRMTSDALRAGRVVLYQGRWNGNNTITTCEGKKVVTRLDEASLRRITARQRRASLAVSVAWLEAPEGVQLLLVANSDFCHWQPKEASF